MESLSLGAPRRSLMVLTPAKYTCRSSWLHMFLKLSLRPLVYVTTMFMFLFYVDAVLFLVLLFEGFCAYYFLSLPCWGACISVMLSSDVLLYIFCSYDVVAVPVQVLVCVSGISVNCSGKGFVWFWHHQDVKKRYWTTWSYFFHCKLYAWGYGIDMLKEPFAVRCFLYQKCVIHIPSPYS